ncbi:MAG: UDP-N-acetylenolpyruvoylglucosamine reductase [Crocinitomix sp. MedPE-SWsnd]|nr:MAG: UDP-N-acetylenolpyruvoylglucosamine reductase [Crocinitomix sp. MedPE-SWsnd]
MIQENVSLKAHNTFGLDVKAKRFATFNSINELKSLLSENQSSELFILGGGSNVLLTQDVSALVLKNELRGIEITSDSDDVTLVKAMAGEVWHDFVMFAVEQGLGGIENLSLIPGSVGAAPMQNIGAYGTEIKDVFHSLEALKISTGEIEVFNADQCNFGYRESVFKRAMKGEYVIVSMTLRLSRNSKINTSYGAIEARLSEMNVTAPTIKDVSDAVIHIRQTKLPDPKEIGNSGSFFKNPVISKKQFEELKSKFPDVANYPVDEDHIKIAAGWLIDQTGWKGKTLGTYGVHKNQALVLVNYGGSQGKDIYQLSEDIMANVKEIYGIELEREVNVI